MSKIDKIVQGEFGKQSAIPITPQTTTLFREAFDTTDPSIQEIYDATKIFTQMYLFSQYDFVRKGALAKVQSFFESPTQIRKVHATNGTYAYLALLEAKRYAFIGVYEETQWVEEVPTPSEEASWRSQYNE